MPCLSSQEPAPRQCKCNAKSASKSFPVCAAHVRNARQSAGTRGTPYNGVVRQTGGCADLEQFDPLSHFWPVNRFGNYVVLTPPKLPYPVDLLHSPYTVVSTTVRHCERNITFVFLCTRVRSARLYIFCCEADQIPRAGPCDSRTPIRCPTTVRRMMAPRHASLPVMPCPRTTYSLW